MTDLSTCIQATCIQATLFFPFRVQLALKKHQQQTTTTNNNNKQNKKDTPFPWQLLYTKVDHMTQF